MLLGTIGVILNLIQDLVGFCGVVVWGLIDSWVVPVGLNLIKFEGV